jgi:hypothetical protein
MITVQLAIIFSWTAAEEVTEVIEKWIRRELVPGSKPESETASGHLPGSKTKPGPKPNSDTIEVSSHPAVTNPLAFFKMGLNPTRALLTTRESLGFRPSPKNWATVIETQSKSNLRSPRLFFRNLGYSSFRFLTLPPPWLRIFYFFSINPGDFSSKLKQFTATLISSSSLINDTGIRSNSCISTIGTGVAEILTEEPTAPRTISA